MAKTYDASVFSPLPFPPKGQSPFPLQPCHQASLPQMHRVGGNPTHFFPSHTEKKQTTARQTKKNVVRSGRQPKFYNTHGAVM